MGHRDKMKSGDEYDALTRWRRLLRWRPGQRRRIKQQHNKRLRREALDRLVAEAQELDMGYGPNK